VLELVFAEARQVITHAAHTSATESQPAPRRAGPLSRGRALIGCRLLATDGSFQTTRSARCRSSPPIRVSQPPTRFVSAVLARPWTEDPSTYGDCGALGSAGLRLLGSHPYGSVRLNMLPCSHVDNADPVARSRIRTLAPCCSVGLSTSNK